MDPQSCTKCNSLPEDILMLACSHDLCLNCASERLAFEMKKKNNVNSIVCEFCYERTPLDAESVSELQKLIPASKLPAKAYNEPTSTKYEAKTDSKYESKYQSKYDQKYSPASRSQLPEYNYSKPTNRGYEVTDRSKVGSSEALQGISSKKQCSEHVEEEILYFCFDCKCECICPECVIHGKHKDHDVKTIRKSHPIVKAEVQSSIERMENNIESLLIKRSEIQKEIKILNEQNNTSKRQIQQTFEDLRSRINAQEKEILSRWDQRTNDNINEMEGILKDIVARVDSIKAYTSTIREAERKEDILFLNFYSKKWQEIKNEEREPDRKVPEFSVSSNEPILSAILDVNDQVSRIGVASSRHRNI